MKTEKNLKQILLAIKRDLKKILLGSVLCSIFGSLLIGFGRWALSGMTERIDFMRGAPVGIIYFMLMALNAGVPTKVKVGEFNFLRQAKPGKPPEPIFGRGEKFSVIFIFLVIVLLYYLMADVFVSSRGRMGGYVGYWIGMAWLFSVPITATIMFVIGLRNTLRILKRARE